MSQSPNYMDGIPVKISERFKPPPKISLPQSVINRLAHFDNGVAFRVPSTYEFDLEETVLRRISEWRAAKEMNRYERIERVRLKDKERARLEEEDQKRKLNQISYPNTDELSSASEEGEDDASEENDESLPSGSSEEQYPQNGEHIAVQSKTGQYRLMNKFDTILIPTVLPDISTANTISTREQSSDSDSSKNFHIPKSTSLLNNNNNGYNKINYSDFENDTSSPFDNMELKTINDLDILAQVLNLNVSNHDLERSPESKKVTANFENRQETTVNVTPVTVAEGLPQFGYNQQLHHQHPVYQMPQQQGPSTSDYYKTFTGFNYQYSQYSPASATSTASYTPSENLYLGNVNSTANTSYQSGVQQMQNLPYNQSTGSTSFNYYPYASSGNNPTTRTAFDQNFIYSNAYTNQNQLVPSAGYSYATQSAAIAATPSTQSSITHDTHNDLVNNKSSTIRSKSKSVPDIVRQLHDEVHDSAQKRTRNNSQSIAEQREESEKELNDRKAIATASKPDFTLYNQLSSVDQNLVKRISCMGFPIERVAAVLKRLGNDDKKIIEHLIPLSELLDLGFDEEQISAALIKFSNNKHKALDYLIS